MRATRKRRATKGQDRKAQKHAAHAWQGLVDSTLPPGVPKKLTKRGAFAKKFPTLDGHGVQPMHPRIVHVGFYVTQEVAAALRALRGTGIFGNGVDCASIAEELLRRALLDPQVLPYWQKSR